ncbi:MAG: glutathione S-transferase family protein [Alphaproteobacteria bacterium]|nr:glutathione S-transferase family protein [Alphaproteobacteria bacterium]
MPSQKLCRPKTGKRTTLALYHNSMSSCSQKVRLSLAEKGLDWEGRHLDLRAGDTQTVDYLKLNRRGVVPTLDHEGMIVCESNVILEYLEDAFPDHSLRPSDAFGKAEMRLWTMRLDEGHHDLATASLSMGVAFRHQFLERGEEECIKLIDAVPDPVKRERRRDLIFKGLDAPVFREAVRCGRRWCGMWMRHSKAGTGLREMRIPSRRQPTPPISRGSIISI